MRDHSFIVIGLMKVLDLINDDLPPTEDYVANHLLGVLRLLTSSMLEVKQETSNTFWFKY